MKCVWAEEERYLWNCVPLISTVSFLSFYLYNGDQNKIREVVKTTILRQGSPNHKIDGRICLHPPPPPLYPAVKNDNEIPTSLFLFM